MIAALSPAAINYDETLSTLRFAQNVSVISTKQKQQLMKKLQLFKEWKKR